MKSLDDNECKGCMLYTTYGTEVCRGVSKAKIGGVACPCMKCLVKMMCMGVCDEFKKHRISIGKV